MSYRALQPLLHCVHVPQVIARDAVMAILLYEESLVDRFGMQSSCILVCVCTRCTPACSVPCTCCARCCGHTVTFITTYYRNALCAYNMIWVSLSTGYSVLNISPCPHFKSDKAGSYIGLEVCTYIQCIAITANHVHSCPRFHDTLYSYSMYS